MDEIERLKEEIKINDDELLNAQTKISELLTYLNYEKEDILQEICLIEKKKLEKLGISETTINAIKKYFIV